MIIATETGIIVELIRKPNAIIVLQFIQSISKILTTLHSRRSSENFVFGTITEYVQLLSCRYFSKGLMSLIGRFFLRGFVFVPFSLNQ